MNMFRSLSGLISSSVGSISGVQQSLADPSPPPPPSVRTKTPVGRGVPIPRSASATPRLRLSPSPPPPPPPPPPQTSTVRPEELIVTTTKKKSDAVASPLSPSSGTTSSPDSEPPILGDDDYDSDVNQEDDDVIDDAVGHNDDIVDSSDENVEIDNDDDSSDSEYGRRSPLPRSPSAQDVDLPSELPEIDSRHQTITPLPKASVTTGPPQTRPGSAAGRETTGGGGGIGWNSRRSSATSLTSEPPDIDLSHLSEEEKALIALVMEKARMMEDEVVAAAVAVVSSVSTSGSPSQQQLANNASIEQSPGRGVLDTPEVPPVASREPAAPANVVTSNSSNVTQRLSEKAKSSAEERGQVSTIDGNSCDSPPEVEAEDDRVKQHRDRKSEDDDVNENRVSQSVLSSQPSPPVAATSSTDASQGAAAVAATTAEVLSSSCRQCGTEQTPLEDGCCRSCSQFLECTEQELQATEQTTSSLSTDVRASDVPAAVSTDGDIQQQQVASQDQTLKFTSNKCKFDPAAAKRVDSDQNHHMTGPAEPPGQSSHVVVDGLISVRRPVLEDGLSPAVSPSELDGGSDNDPDDVIDDNYGGAVFQKIFSRPRNLHIGRHSSVPSASVTLTSSSLAARSELSSKRRSSTGSPGSSSASSDSSEHATPLSSTSSASSTSSGVGGVQMRHHQHVNQIDVVERRRSVPPASVDRSSSVYQQQQQQHDGLAGPTSAERNQSPSRRSPKSPPRSPSAWMQRMRESPTRATQPGGGSMSGGRGPTGGGMRSPTQLSPGSAVERYPSNELHEAPVGMPSSASDDETAAGHGAVDGHDVASGVNGILHRGTPRRVSSEVNTTSSVGIQSAEVQRVGGVDSAGGHLLDLSESTTLDLASFAASVASGAAHLTQLSNSPPDVVVLRSPNPVTDPGHQAATAAAVGQPLISGTVTIISSSGPSFIATDFLSPDEYVSIGSFDVRQQHQQPNAVFDIPGANVPPPAPPCPQDDEYDDNGGQTSSSSGAAAGSCGDWSLRVDLSPIIDVSPSIERIEQEIMIADQLQLQASNIKSSTSIEMDDERKNQAKRGSFEALEPSPASFGLGTAESIESKITTSNVETSPTMFGLMKRCSSFSDIPTLTSQDDPQQPTPLVTIPISSGDFVADVFRFDDSSTPFEASLSNGKQQLWPNEQLVQPQHSKDDTDKGDELVGGLQKFDDWFKAAFQELISQDSSDSTQQTTPTKFTSSPFSMNANEPADEVKQATVSSASSVSSNFSQQLSEACSAPKESGTYGYRREAVDPEDEDEDDDLIHHEQFADLEHDEVDEDHEIDLDEDIPPKHVFVATSKFRKQRTLEKQDAIDENSGPSTRTATSDEYENTGRQKSLQSGSSFDELINSNRSSSRRKLPAVPEGVDPFSQGASSTNGNNTGFDATRLRRMGSLTYGSKSASADDALYGRKSSSGTVATNQQPQQNPLVVSTATADPTNILQVSGHVIQCTRRGRGTFTRSKSADEKTGVSVRPVYCTRPVGTELYDFEDDEEMNAYFRQRSLSLQPEAIAATSSSLPKPPLPPPRPIAPVVPPKPASLTLDRRTNAGKTKESHEIEMAPETAASISDSTKSEPQFDCLEDGDKSPEDFSDTPTIVRRPGSTSTQRGKAPTVDPLTAKSSSLEVEHKIAPETNSISEYDRKAVEKQETAKNDVRKTGKEIIDPTASLVKPEIPPKPPRLRPKVSIAPSPVTTTFKQPTLPPTMITVCRGLQVPDVVHAKQLRVKDEIKIVTATKRLRLDEDGEVRIMEAEFAERVREQERKRQQAAKVSAILATEAAGEGRDVGNRYVERLTAHSMAEFDALVSSDYLMSQYLSGVDSGRHQNIRRDDYDESSDFRIGRDIALTSNAAATNRMSHYHGATDAAAYRQRGGGSESDMGMYDFRFPPIEEDFGIVDEDEMDDKTAAFMNSMPPRSADEITGSDSTTAMMFSPKSIYLGTSALQVRGGDRKSPAFATIDDDNDPWSTRSVLREQNLSRSTDLLKSSAANCSPKIGNSKSPSIAGSTCRRSASSSAMAVELTSATIAAAVAAELNADDADDFYRQLSHVTERDFCDYKAIADLERRTKEEKLLQLQMEIERRRRHLNELSQNESRVTTAGCGGNTQQRNQQQQQHNRREASPSSGIAADWQQKNFGQRALGMERYKYQTLPARTSLQNTITVRPQPQQAQPAQQQQQQSLTGSGLIKPIDYQIDVEKYYLQSSEGKPSNCGRQQVVELTRGLSESGAVVAPSTAIYSSFEYLAHRAEFSPPQSQHQQQTSQRSQHPQSQHHRHQSTASVSSAFDDYATTAHQMTTGSSRSSSFVVGGGGTLDRFRREDSGDRLSNDHGVVDNGNTGSIAGGGHVGTSVGERFTYSTSEDSLAYCSSSAGGGAPTMNHAGSRDSGVSSSLTGGETYATNCSLLPSSSAAYVRSVSTSGTAERGTSLTSATERVSLSASPPTNGVFDELYAGERSKSVIRHHQNSGTTSGYEPTTPAMPILDDVTSRSRNRLRDIGSRPLSDDVEKYFQAEEPLNLMFCEESEYSLAAAADSGDENVMEGGLTIRQQQYQRCDGSSRLPRRLSSHFRSYNFPTKCILLTADPKTAKGNGIGVKVIGGELLPWADNQVGAYVASILPGSVAHQLHGELHEGDQVLEWNGEPLTGKSYEEVRDITSYCNGGEVELVVRPAVFSMNASENRSFYDNMDLDGSYQESVTTTKSQPDLNTQAPPSYSESLVLTGHVTQPSPAHVAPPKLSANGSLTRRAGSNADGDKYLSEQALQHMQLQQPKSNESSLRRQGKSAQYTGEIQLQLSYDDYDGTLNVTIIKARNLLPKYKSGYADPYVKVYLLPYKSPEQKGRTKNVARTLEPDWHRTLVFLNIPKDELTVRGVEISVWDHDRFVPHQCLGEIVLDLADSSCLDNQPHWYPLFEEDQSTRFGRRPRVQMISPSDSSESSTTTRRSSIDSLGGATSAAGLDPSGASVVKKHRKQVSTGGSRFRGHPDGSPVLQQVRAGVGSGVNGATGSGASTPRRRMYGHESPAAASGTDGSIRRDVDDNLIVTEDSFENDNEECMDELFLKHHDDHTQLQQQKQKQQREYNLGDGSSTIKHHLTPSVASHGIEQHSIASNRMTSAVFDSTPPNTFFGLLSSIFCCLRPLCGSARQIIFPLDSIAVTTKVLML